MPRIDSDVPGQASLDYEAWRDLVRAVSGRFNPEGVHPTTFTGWVRLLNVCDFTAAYIGSNAQRIVRTNRDVRLDGVDHFCTMFQLAGRSGMTHNDEAMRLDVGDVVLVDAARPVTFVAEDQGEPWNCITLSLSRQSLVSHLGFEPRGGLCRHGGTTAGRLLLELIRSCERDKGSASPSADPYMRLAVYDLLGSLFAPADPVPANHADKLFRRIRGIVEDGFVDPELSPSEVAAKAGISLRYLQQLFTQRGLTCGEFIYSLRLDHAARLLQHRGLLRRGQSLSEIAYACGFRDYAHFARRFRHRFGRPPGAHAAGLDGTPNGAHARSP